MKKVTFLGVLSLLFLSIPSIWAQSPAAQVSGQIRDASGAVIPGVVLEAHDQENGRVSSALTDEEGRYEFLRLAPGKYEIFASYRGFQSIQDKKLPLSAGQAVSLDLILEVQDAEQSITVIGEAATLDLSSPHLSSIVNEVSFSSLPINGRSIDSLALLAPGMIPVRGKDTRALNGTTQEISGNGARGTEYLLDGTDIQHPILKSTPGGVSGLLLGIDSVQEFEVLNDAYPAYLGGSGGATVNVITRRGTRDWHGSAYGYFRNSAMDARNFFDIDPSNPEKRSDPPPFNRQQYGGSIGGPLPGEENTFFFSYEGLRERLGMTLINTVPTDDASQGLLPTGSVTVADEIKPILDLYPRPNGGEFPDRISAEYLFQQQQPTNDQHFNVRTDFQLGSSDSLFVRYTFHDSEKLAPFEVSIEGFDSDLSSRNQYLTVEETHLFSSRLLHTAQFAYNRGAYTSNSVASTPELAAVPPLIPGRPNMGRINIRGLTAFGTDTADVDFPFSQYQTSSAFHFSSGNHDLRWGFDWKHHRSDGAYNFFFDGLLVYESLEDFLINDTARFIGAEADADAQRAYRQNLFALYVHDQFRFSPSLTLSYGLRYEWFTVPTEKLGRISNLRRLTDADPTVGDPLFKNPSHLNFAPRVGLAWNLGGDQTTVLRTGFGIFYEPIRENIFGYRVRIQTPFTTVRTIINPPYPDPLGGGRAGRPRQDPIEFEVSTPYMMRYHLMLEQLLGQHLVLRVGYSGSRGVHLTRVADTNIPAPISVDPDGRLVFDNVGRPRRPNSNLDAVRLSSNDANSVYNSLQIGLTRHWASGFQFLFNYTYGRSLDDASAYRREFTNSLPESPYYYDRRSHRGLSSFHIAHHAVLQYTWDLPSNFPPTSFAGILLNDWQTAGILTLSSGYPFTANVSFDIANNGVREGHRPDLVPGFSNNPTDTEVSAGCPGVVPGTAIGGRLNWFDACAFELQPRGRLGRLGRNTLIGPGFATLDMAVTRTVPLTEQRSLQFRLEVFNLLNRVNFSHPQNRGAGGGVIIFNNLSGVPIGNAATIFSTTSSSRQLQLGLRYTF